MAAFHVRVGAEGQRLRQAQASQYGSGVSVALVHLDGGWRVDRHVLVIDTKAQRQRTTGSCREVTDHVVPVAQDIVRRCGRAALREIRGRCGKRPAQRGDLPRDQAGVVARAADGAVDALAYEVHGAIGNAQLHPDPGIARAELGQHRQDEPCGDGTAGIHAQIAGGQTPPGVQRGLEIIQVGQPASRVLVVRSAFGRHRHAPGGAVQQAHAQITFEALDQLGDRRLGHLQRVSGPSEAAGFHQAVENPDGEEAIHDCFFL